jgi:hypothetical protein
MRKQTLGKLYFSENRLLYIVDKNCPELYHLHTYMHLIISQLCESLPELLRGDCVFVQKVGGWKQPISNDYRNAPFDLARNWEDGLLEKRAELMATSVGLIVALPVIACLKSDYLGVLWLILATVCFFLYGVADNRNDQLRQLAIHADNVHLFLRPVMLVVLGVIQTITIWFSAVWGIKIHSHAPPHILRHYTNQHWEWESNKTTTSTALKLRPNVQPTAPSY